MVHFQQRPITINKDQQLEWSRRAIRSKSEFYYYLSFYLKIGEFNMITVRLSKVFLTFAIALVLLSAVGVTSAAINSPDPARNNTVQADDCPTAKDSYVIGFANLTEDIPFTQLVEQGIQEAADEAGNIEIVLADNKLDGATALANDENFLTQGVDGVIEFQTDAAFGNVIMSRFRAADRKSTRLNSS